MKDSEEKWTVQKPIFEEAEGEEGEEAGGSSQSGAAQEEAAAPPEAAPAAGGKKSGRKRKVKGSIPRFIRIILATDTTDTAMS